MKRSFFLILFLSALTVPLLAGPFNHHRSGGSFIDPPGITLDDITLSNNSFLAGSPTGTLVGVATVITTNGAFTGSQAPSGAAAANFAFTGCSGATCNLVTVGTLCSSSPPCTYSLDDIATQVGATGSPKTKSFTITATAPGTLSTTPQFVNDGASPTVAGTPTQTFMQWFNDGDLCGGAAPIFKDGATVQPYSASPPNARLYWDSGCLKGATFQLLPTFSVAAGATKNIAVTGGGSWPTMGVGMAGRFRTLQEVYDQNLKMNFSAIPGVAVPYSDTFSVVLNDANKYKIVKWLDGDAGTYWKFSINATGGGGSAHRVGDIYIQALNNASTSLGGFRWLGTLRQPFYNLDSPTKTQLYLLAPNPGSPVSSTNWSVNAPGGGTATFAPPWPYGGAAQAFTVSGGVAQTTSSNTFFQGSVNGRNVVPVLVNCSPCPSGLSNNGGYFALSNGANQFDIAYEGSAAGDRIITSSLGNGSGTISPIVFQSTFGRFPMANIDGEYLFFQGSGSITTETTLRFKPDKQYLSSAKVIPPYNLTYTAADLTSAYDQLTTNFSYNWGPYSIGNYEWTQSAAGQQPSIGRFSNTHAVDFIAQTKTTDRVSRMVGLSSALNPYDFKTYHPGFADHDQVLNFLSGTYIGMSNTGPQGSLAFTLYWEAGLTLGFTAPAYGVQLGYDSANFEHKPEFALWPYMKTGELQYLDYVDEMAQCSLLCEHPSLRNPLFPSSRVGVATAWGDSVSTAEARAIGWGFRDQSGGALVHPFDPTNPDALDHNGTQYGKYLRDAVANSIQLMADIQAGQNNFFDFYTGGSAATAHYSPLGFWTPFFDDMVATHVGYATDFPEWERSFVFDGVAFAAMSGNTLARTVLANNAVWLNHLLQTLGGYSLYGYYEAYGDPSTGNCGAINHCTHNMYTNDNQFTVNTLNAWYGTAFIDWDAAGFTSSPKRYFRLNPGPDRYQVGNGDHVVGNPSYTIQDFDGVNFNVALSDSPFTLFVPTGTGRFPGWAYMPVFDRNNCPGAGCNGPSTADYFTIIRSSMNWTQAILDGNANAHAVQLDAEYRMQNNTYQGVQTELAPQGARNALANHFGP